MNLPKSDGRDCKVAKDSEITRRLRPAYTLVRNDEGDWIGLYGPDGRLIREGHSFESSELLELVGVAHDVVYEVDLSEEGRLPASLGEVAALPPESKPMRKVRP